MVLLDRIELSASPLPRECSTTELQQRDHRSPLAADEPTKGAGAPYNAACPCQSFPPRASLLSMSETKPTREERLAARLRENLRLRKAQARALKTGEANSELPNSKDDR